MNELDVKVKMPSKFLKNVPLDEFDWDACVNDDKIFKYKDKDTAKMSNKFKETLALYDGIKQVERKIDAGMVVNGEIISMSKREMVVDFNYKDNIFIDQKLSEWNILGGFHVGDTVDVLIKEIQDTPYLIKGSVIDLLKMKVNDKMTEYFEQDKVLIGKVTELIPAGYILNLTLDNLNLPAFMPNTLADVNKLHDPSMLLGKEIEVMLETLQQEKGVYVVSRKKYLKTLIPEKIKNLKHDTVYEGYVTGTTPFGVFVQFEECLTGMVHKANINENFRDKIDQIQPGTLIDFYVKEITKSKKIILTQFFEESLWDTIQENQILEGEVLTIKPYGALIKLDYETTGLIQTTILNKYRRIINSGDKLNVKIINIVKDYRKIYLTFADEI